MQLAGAQLGITIASLGLGVVAEPAMEHLLEPVAHFLHLPSSLAVTVSAVVGLSIVVFLHLVVGELVPKNLAMADPERTLRWLVLPNRAYLFVCRPLVRALNVLGNLGARAFGVQPRDELGNVPTAEELTVMLDRLARRGADRGLRPRAAHRRARLRRARRHLGDGPSRRDPVAHHPNDAERSRAPRRRERPLPVAAGGGPRPRRRAGLRARQGPPHHGARAGRSSRAAPTRAPDAGRAPGPHPRGPAAGHAPGPGPRRGRRPMPTAARSAWSPSRTCSRSWSATSSTSPTDAGPDLRARAFEVVLRTRPTSPRRRW